MQTTSSASLDPSQPHTYPRRIMLAVSGLSPQIVTETVFGLTQKEQPAWVPTEIHLLTTTEGAQRARLALFSKDLDWFNRLCTDYGLPPIAFNSEHIHVLQHANGALMDDIRTLKDNGAAADAITAKVRELTSDTNSALHISIAGGRKSMGFYVGYALSLFGRSQDRLSHVLVNEPYENTLDFFYPTPYNRVLQTRDGRYADTKDAVVSLADIPFVSLRNGMPAALLSGNTSFQETVKAAQLALRTPELKIHRRDGYIIAAGRKIAISATGLALLSVFARRIVDGLPPVSAPSKESYDLDWKAWYEQEYRYITRLFNDENNTTMQLKKGMQGGTFSTIKSRLTDLIKRELGPAASPYLITDDGSRFRKFYLNLPTTAVQFLD
jgi:CRISPR-associated protein (TIGR02584 family)